MRYFLDTEFNDLGDRIDLISIGIVREDGLEWYAESSDSDHSKFNPWLLENVAPKLRPEKAIPRQRIIKEIRCFLAGDSECEFWGYYCSYDWVVFCQLFGGMLSLPKEVKKYIHDLKVFQSLHGISPSIPSFEEDHNALCDARRIRSDYLRLASPC